MSNALLYPIGCSDSCRYASSILQRKGIRLTDHPTPEITHLLLDVPSFSTNGSLPDGSELQHHLQMLPEDITIIGGNLDQDCISDYTRIDLLKDPHYLAKNAAITADCAIRVAAPHLKTTFRESAALILGWGRIGKCLSGLLDAMGCPVTVAARKESDRAMLQALGFSAIDFDHIPNVLHRYRLLFNTVPAVPLHSQILTQWSHGIAIDLASYPGMQGSTVIPARGLPGKYAPESSGTLIAGTILKLLKEDIL